jgi:hypothetical protein
LQRDENNDDTVNKENNASVQIVENSEAKTATNGPATLSWQMPQIAVPRIMFTGLDPDEVFQFQRVSNN